MFPPKSVRTAQFNIILNESPVIIIRMRVNMCLPESVPRVIPHLETRITYTSFIQNNIKSGSPGMCSNIRPGFSICTYRLQTNTEPKNHKEQFYITRLRDLILQVPHRRGSTNFHYKPWAHRSHIKQTLEIYYIYMLSRSSITIKTY